MPILPADRTGARPPKPSSLPASLLHMPLIVASHRAFGGGLFISPRRRGREPTRAAVPCTLPGGKWRAAPCNPAFPRSQPTARRSERRAARGWTACARAYHRARPRYALLWPSASAAAVESDSLGTVPARSSHVRQGLPTPPPHCASRSARNFRETSRCAETCPASSVLSPLTRFGEGVRRGQAVRRRAGRGASAAPVPERHSHGRRTKNGRKVFRFDWVDCSRGESALSFVFIETSRGVKE